MCMAEGLLSVVMAAWGLAVKAEPAWIVRIERAVALRLAHLFSAAQVTKRQEIVPQAMRRRSSVLHGKVWASHWGQKRDWGWSWHCCCCCRCCCRCYAGRVCYSSCRSSLHHVVAVAEQGSTTPDGEVTACLVLHRVRRSCRFSSSFLLHRAPCFSEPRSMFL